MDDPLLSQALHKFCEVNKAEFTDKLLVAVRSHVRDTMKEAAFAGRVAAYEELMSDLRRFAEEQLRAAR